MSSSLVAQILRLRTQIFLRRRAWQRRRQPALPPNADAITPQLVVGAFIDEADWRQLFNQGIRVVVSLQGERHDEDTFGELQPTGYLRLPTPDFNPPTLAQLRMGAAFINEAIRAGEIVLVHCHAGVGRSTMQCAAYLMLNGMELDAAWELIKSKRIKAVWNERQEATMQAFAAALMVERQDIAGELVPKADLAATTEQRELREE
ncbi:MAG: dual specificity protein phosphatase family protein [Herpetosiphonaceae bacterium]|nr:dual specificity protein phosphatase family protein [Herpetosiphonaceae bacterium]